jgi:hypothetical protein
LLKTNESKLRPLGVKLEAPHLLMEMEELEWSMDEFLEKAGDFAPTLVLIKMKNGTACGGVAGAPWPKGDAMAADPAKGSFTFSLGPASARCDLVEPYGPLCCAGCGFLFGWLGYVLSVFNDGHGCGSWGHVTYAGPREMGQLIGGTAEDYYQPYERWEFWRL